MSTMIYELTERDSLRFWGKVQKSPKGCWLWQFVRRATNNGTGRAMFSVAGQSVPAARIMWYLTYGPIKGNLFVLHTCDNAACVKPTHLFLGTQSDNVKDSVKKGRYASTREGEMTASR